MKIHLHKNAKTTPAQRAFIQASIHLNTAELAQKTGVSQTTIRKWKKRTSVYDRPHIPHKIPSVLTPLQETLVVLTRLCLRSGLDDLHMIVRRFIYPEYARSSLNRCLKRYQISRLEPLPVHPPPGINDHRGTFLYYSVIHLPDIFDTRGFEFIHVFLDCTSRWVHMEITPCSYLDEPCQFIKGITANFPLKILGIIARDLINLSDTDMGIAHETHTRFLHTLGKARLPFELITDQGHLATRRLIEENRLSEMKPDCSNFIGSLGELKSKLLKNLSFYNTQLPQRTLRQRTPIEAIRHRYILFPGSFRSRPE